LPDLIARWLRPAASDHAALLDGVLSSVHTHMFVIFAGWLALFVIALIRFRRGANPEARKQGVRGVWPVLAIGAVIAGDVYILAAKAVPAWSIRNAEPATTERPFEVHVIAEQFAWNIHYPGPDGVFGRTDAASINASNPVGIDRTDPAAADDIGLQNVLMLPVHRTVVVRLTSRDVIHSFTLNEMRVKQDVVPGMFTHTWFTPTATGDWEIACSQLCGLGHYRMRGEYHVLDQAAWTEWQAGELLRLARP
jgi:cytochrome c oxidase subunit 2